MKVGEIRPSAMTGAGTEPGFNVQEVRKDFPILARRVHGKPLVYLDNAATSQKPRPVIEAVSRFYTEACSNIHRGIHALSVQATEAYEQARVRIQHFLNAEDPGTIIFVRGATEAINLVAQTYGRQHVQAGDEILISEMEHHSNIVPWQMLREEKGAVVRVAPVNDRGELVLDELERLLSPRTKMVSVTHMSNVLGTINPLRRIIEMAHRKGIPVMVDGAQAVPHLPVDVRELDCDFYTFSGHKVYGPTGIGVLYGKRSLLEQMPPYQGGGDMISSVTFERTIYNKLPYKFEAGTPNIAGGIGLGAAVNYLRGLNAERRAAYEAGLLAYATEQVRGVPGVRILGTAPGKSSILSFVLEGVHPHDIGTVLDQEGIAIRTGHHCAQPLMQRFKVPATARASFAFYNTREEVDRLVEGLHTVGTVFV